MSDSMYFPFTNSLYDKCNIKRKDQESIGQYNYIMSPVYENENKCFENQTPFQHTQFHSIPGSIVDVESDLRNQTRMLSRCPETRFNPTHDKNCSTCKNCNSGLPCDCQHCKQTKYENKINDCAKDNSLIPAYTRINKPCNIFSGININRFNPLCQDLQDSNTIHSNSYIGSNTRLQIKDAYKKANPSPSFIAPKASTLLPLTQAQFQNYLF